MTTSVCGLRAASTARTSSQERSPKCQGDGQFVEHDDIVGPIGEYLTAPFQPLPGHVDIGLFGGAVDVAAPAQCLDAEAAEGGTRPSKSCSALVSL